MKIQVIGSGCNNCKRLHELTKEVVTEHGLKAEVEYSTDITKIIAMGIMQSPVLAVDGKAVMVGFSPDKEKIRKAILTHK
jgi:small redox-active disulfide protein 2